MKALGTGLLLTKICLLAAALLCCGRGTAAAAGAVTEWGMNTGLPTTTDDISAIAAGTDHTLALTAGGFIRAWGNNTSGQLNLPFDVQDGGILAVAAGDRTSYALKSDGSVRAWGNGFFFLNWTGITSISARGFALAGVTTGGTVLVNGGTSPPPGLTGVTQVSAGSNHFLARLANGTVVAWGNNSYGQTGVPVGLTGVTAVAAGQYHSLALKSDGTVAAWGAAGFSPGTFPDYGQAVVPAGLAGVSAIAAGGYHSLAVKSDGSLVGWGDNSSGQLSPPAGLGALQAVAAEGFRSVAISTPAPDIRIFEGQHRVADGIRQDFGVVNPGASVSRTFALTNYGNATLAVSSVTTDGLDAARFSVSTLTQTILPVGSYTEFTVTFSPTAAGPYFAALHVASNDPDEPVVDINLTGRTLLAAAAWPENPGPGAMPDGLTDLREVSGSGTYGAVLKGDGTIVSWGGDSEVGLGSRIIPGQARTFALGGIEGALVKADGSVWTWSPRFGGVSQILPAGSQIVRIAAGNEHFLFLKADGRLSGWGDNSSGQLNIPVGLSNLIAFSAGGEHSLAVTDEGRVLAWGRNNNGQINVPPGLQKVVDVAGGQGFSLALKSDGTVAAWGDNTYGQLNIPPGLSGVIAVAAHDIKALALKSDGSIVSWGYGGVPWPARLGRAGAMAVGRSSVLALVIPAPLAEISLGFAVIGAGGALDFSWTTPGTPVTKTLTIRNRGTLPLTLGPGSRTGAYPADYSIGVPGAASLAPGAQTTVSITFSPAAIGARPAVLNIPTNDPQHNPCRIALVGRTPMAVASWGWNVAGQTDQPPGLGDMVALAAGYNHSLALRSNGTVVAWGENRYGQTNVPPVLTGVKAIAAGQYHSLALKTDGTVVGWGLTDYQINPPPVLTGIKAIAGGGFHSLALTNDGRVLGWGLDLNGRTDAPPGITGVGLIAAGFEHSLVSLTDEFGRPEVLGFGGNTQGQLDLRFVTAGAIASGDYHNLVLQSDGTVVAWGSNQFGQSTVPAGLGGVTAITAGVGYSGALKSDGSASLWGLNSFGKTTLPSGLGLLGGITAGGNHALALVSPMPDVAVTYGINRVEDGGSVGFGVSGTSGSDVRTFTILNRGTLPLSGLALTKNGVDATAFSFTVPATTTLAPGASTTFTVTFSTAAAGNRSAALYLASNDPDESSYDIALNGSTGLTPLEVWRQTWFGSPLNGGLGWNENDPDSDLTANFLEFAFGTNPIVHTGAALRYTGALTGGGTLVATGNPTILHQKPGNALEVRGAWVRRKDAGASGLTYTPQVSADLTSWTTVTSAPSVLASDADYELAAIPLAVLPGGKVPRFFRLQVTVAP